MFDSGVTSKIAAKHIQRQYEMIKDNLGIETEILLLSTRSEWEAAIMGAEADGVAFIIIGLYHTLIDEGGERCLLIWCCSGLMSIQRFHCFLSGIFQSALGKQAVELSYSEKAKVNRRAL